MNEENQLFLRLCDILTDVVLVVLAMLLSYFLRFWVFNGEENMPLSFYVRSALLISLLYLLLFSTLGLYESKQNILILPIIQQVILVSLGCTAVLAMFYFTSRTVEASRILILFFFILSSALLSGKRALHYRLRRTAYSRGLHVRPVLLVGSGPSAEEYRRTLADMPWLGYQLLGSVGAKPLAADVPYLGTLDDLDEVLRNTTAEELVAATNQNHHITVDGYVLTESPYESYRKGVHNEEAIFHGYNLTESALFTLFDNASMKNYEKKVRAYFGDRADEVLALYPASTDAEAKAAWIDIYSAVFFNYGHYCWTRQALAGGEPVYEYFFTKSNGRLGGNHGGEEVYFYGNIPAGSKLYDASDRALGEIMHAYFRNFIASGDPNGSGLPAWNAVTDPTRIFELGENVGETDERWLGIYAILDEMQGWQD